MPNASATVVRGAQLLFADGPRLADLRIEAGRIAAIGDAVDDADAHAVDGTGGYLTPGFIDLQINGLAGYDLTESPASIGDVASLLPRHGVTSFLPTLISPDVATIDAALMALHTQRPTPGGATPLGLHIEGPLISTDARGMHPVDRIGPLPPGYIDDWRPQTGVRLVTLAPEIDDAENTIRTLTANGVTVAAGHSQADHDQAQAGFDAGITMVTHLFNAMAPIHHRRPGLAGAAMVDDRIQVAIIVDGLHLHPATVALTLRSVGVDRLIVVSDAVGPSGLEPGRHRVAGVEVTMSPGGAIRDLDGALAGPSVLLDQALRNLVAYTGCTPADAIRTVTANPAVSLGLKHQGHLAVGRRADMVLLDSALDIQRVWGRRCAHNRRQLTAEHWHAGPLLDLRFRHAVSVTFDQIVGAACNERLDHR